VPLVGGNAQATTAREPVTGISPTASRCLARSRLFYGRVQVRKGGLSWISRDDRRLRCLFLTASFLVVGAASSGVAGGTSPTGVRSDVFFPRWWRMCATRFPPGVVFPSTASRGRRASKCWRWRVAAVCKAALRAGCALSQAEWEQRHRWIIRLLWLTCRSSNHGSRRHGIVAQRSESLPTCSHGSPRQPKEHRSAIAGRW